MFLQASSRDFSAGIQDLVLWKIIMNMLYDSKYSTEIYIRSPIHHFIHHLITFIINYKRHRDKVPTHNLFYLWRIITPGVFCNIHYMLARFLGENFVSSREGSLLLEDIS